MTTNNDDIDTFADTAWRAPKTDAPVKLHTTKDADYERRLQETARMAGVPVERLRQMVEAFNASVFVPDNRK